MFQPLEPRDHVDLGAICRLCLTEPESPLINIFRTVSTQPEPPPADADTHADTIPDTCSLPLRIMACLGLEVQPDTQLPQHLCSACRQLLEQFYWFRRKAQNSDAMLKRHQRLCNAGRISRVFEEAADEYEDDYAESRQLIAGWRRTEETAKLRSQQAEAQRLRAEWEAERGAQLQAETERLRASWEAEREVTMAEQESRLRAELEQTVRDEVEAKWQLLWGEKGGKREAAQPQPVQTKPENPQQAAESVNYVILDEYSIHEAAAVAAPQEANGQESIPLPALSPATEYLDDVEEELERDTTTDDDQQQLLEALREESGDGGAVYAKEELLLVDELADEEVDYEEYYVEQLEEAAGGEEAVAEAEPGDEELEEYMSYGMSEAGDDESGDPDYVGEALEEEDEEDLDDDDEEVDGQAGRALKIKRSGSASSPTFQPPKKRKTLAGRQPTDEWASYSVTKHLFHCVPCEQTFESRAERTQHTLEVHRKQPSHVCDYCERAFPSKSSLVRHVRTHTGEKPFRCDECGKSFIQKEILKRHMHVHTGERPFGCEHCDRRFSQRELLKQHVNRQHMETPIIDLHKCRLCGKTFYHASGLSRHAAAHTGRKFECGQCGKQFSDKSAYRRHLLALHGGLEAVAEAS